MRLADCVHFDHIKVPIDATTKKDALHELLTLLVGTVQLKEPDRVLAKLLEREGLSPVGTYMQNRVAFPHCVTNDDSGGTHVALGMPREPIDWEVEGTSPSPVEIIVLVVVCSGVKHDAYPPLLRFTKLLEPDRVRDAICQATTARDVYDTILREDESLRRLEELPGKGVKLRSEFM